MIAPSPSGGGHLKAWEADGDEPLSSFANFAPGPTLGGSGIIQIGGAPPYNFRIKSFEHATNVVVDVTGYYERQLWGRYDAASGAWASWTASLEILSAGKYSIGFLRDVSDCAYAATLGSDEPARVVALPDPASPNTVDVLTRTLDTNSPVAASFDLLVSC